MLTLTASCCWRILHVHTQTHSVRSIQSTQDGIIGAKRAGVVILLRHMYIIGQPWLKKATEVYTLMIMKEKQHLGEFSI